MFHRGRLKTVSHVQVADYKSIRYLSDPSSVPIFQFVEPTLALLDPYLVDHLPLLDQRPSEIAPLGVPSEEVSLAVDIEGVDSVATDVPPSCRSCPTCLEKYGLST